MTVLELAVAIKAGEMFVSGSRGDLRTCRCPRVARGSRWTCAEINGMAERGEVTRIRGGVEPLRSRLFGGDVDEILQRFVEI